jgi:Protein of unknown function (DUF1579)
MKDRITMLFVAGGLVLAGFSMTATGEAEQAVDATQAAAEQTLEAAEEAVESAEAAMEDVQEMGEELGAAVATVATAGEDVDMAEATEAVELAEAAADEVHAESAQGSMQEMMANWMRIATPGEQHTKLDPFVGQWDVTTRMWFAPGMPPMVSKGTSEIIWVLDGRFIQENFKGQMQMPGAEPQAFEGLGLTGYDIAKAQYIGSWADTMSTASITSSGQFDEATQKLTMSGQFDCPMDGPSKMRMVVGMVNSDEFLLEAYKTVQGQEEAKSMEITYTRKQQ